MTKKTVLKRKTEKQRTNLNLGPEAEITKSGDREHRTERDDEVVNGT